MISDYDLAQKFINKVNSCECRKIEFNLTFAEFKRLYKLKHCEYSGIKLHDISKRKKLTPEEEQLYPIGHLRTIDRIDNKQGYIKGNVVACANAINQVKSLYENPINNIDLSDTIATLREIKRRMRNV